MADPTVPAMESPVAARQRLETPDQVRLHQGLGLAYAIHTGLSLDGMGGSRPSARELVVLSSELIRLLEALVRPRAQPTVP